MAVRSRVPMITTLTGARAAVQAITALRAGTWSVSAMQDSFPELAREPMAPRVIETPWLDQPVAGIEH